MKRFRLYINGLALEYDREYGAMKVTGWSISLHGAYAATLEPSLWRAIRKAWREWRWWERVSQE